MRNFFNSKESYNKQLVKNRLRNKRKRRIERVIILRKLKPEIDKVSAASKLAESLATLVEFD